MPPKKAVTVKSLLAELRAGERRQGALLHRIERRILKWVEKQQISGYRLAKLTGISAEAGRLVVQGKMRVPMRVVEYCAQNDV